MKFLSNRWILLSILALTWGSSFILIKESLKVFDYLQVGSLRIFIAGIFLLPLSFKSFKKIPKKTYKWLLLSGFLGNFAPMFLFPLAQSKIESSLAGILNSLVPIFVLILGYFIFKIKSKKRQILGALLGFFGAAILIFFSTFTGSFTLESITIHFHEIFQQSDNFFYAFYIVLATIFYAISGLIIKEKLSGIPSLELSSVVFSILLIPTILLLLLHPIGFSFQKEFLEGLFFVSILGIFGTALAMILFYRLIQISSTVFATSVTYIMPIIAIIWGIIFGETITIYFVFGGLLILFGVYLIREKKI